jgi:hypothetical protein
VNSGSANAEGHAKLEAALAAAGASARLVVGRVSGGLDLVIGRGDDRDAPSGLADLEARVERVRRAREVALEALAAAAKGDATLAARIGDDAFLAILSGDPAHEADLVAVRREVESTLLRSEEARLSIALAWSVASSAEILSGEHLAALERQLRRREATPMREAIGVAGALSFPSRHQRDSSHPLVPLAHDEDEAHVEGDVAAWLVALLRSGRSDRTAGGFAASDVSSLLAKEAARVPPEARGILRYSGGDGVLLVAPAGEMLAALSGIESTFDGSLAIDGSQQASGIAGAARRAVAHGQRGTWFFGSRVPPYKFGPAIELGRRLAPLASRRPLAFASLVRLAARLDEGMERDSLAKLGRFRAEVHALSATLGMNERAVRQKDDEETGEMAALRALISEFSRWFDTGAARTPLHCARVLAVGASAEE